jgi:hypothetical protein
MDQRTYRAASWRLHPPATRPQISLRLMSFSTRGRPRLGLAGSNFGLPAAAGELLADCPPGRVQSFQRAGCRLWRAEVWFAQAYTNTLLRLSEVVAQFQ